MYKRTGATIGVSDLGCFMKGGLFWDCFGSARDFF